MAQSANLTWKIYTGVLGAVATIAAQKVVSGAWKFATGDEPPSPTDPDTPLGVAITWAVASAAGLAVTQLVTARYAASRIAQTPDKPVQKKLKIKI